MLFWTSTLGQLASGLMLGVGKFEGNIETLDIHIGQAIRGLATHMPADQFVKLSKKLYAESIVFPEYVEADFDNTFSGGAGAAKLFELLVFIIRFNFDDLAPTLKKTLAALTGFVYSDQPDPEAGSEPTGSVSA